MISRSLKGEEDCGQGSDDLGHVRAQALAAVHQVKATRNTGEKSGLPGVVTCSPLLRALSISRQNACK